MPAVRELTLLATSTRHSADVWQPRLFRLTREGDATELRGLIADGRIAHVHDQIEDQVAGLLETRQAHRRFTKTELREAVQEFIGMPPEHFGVWVFYPWSGRLVHVLEKDAYRELRTSRNRNKISNDEQRRLSELHIGVVGLSVGQATALTLALEAVGGHFRLADFDRLELSNMNRLRTGVHNLGERKTVLTAREIYEIDPFADIELFSDGITADNIDRFFAGGTRLDIVFDECDDLEAKVLLRQKARELRIPLVMETSDRGLIDIERFDQEPERPLFHGAVGDLDPKTLRGLSVDDKVPAVLAILGADTLSNRLRASFFDISTTLKTWPQLASAVALGGALNTDAARRIALGTLNGSGRFFVDLERIVGPQNQPPAPHADVPREPTEILGPDTLPSLPVGHASSVDRASVEAVLQYACAAPSGGNCQPWSFQFSAGTQTIRCVHEPRRSRNFLDFENSATHIAFGALIENLQLATRAQGLECQVDLFQVADDPLVVCDVRVRPGAGLPRDPLIDQVGARCTNRRLGSRVPLADSSRDALIATAEDAEARLQVVCDAARLDALAQIIARGDRLRLLNPDMHREMVSELRWTTAEAKGTRDGIDLTTLEVTAADRAVLGLIARPELMNELRTIDGGLGLGRASTKAVAAASAIGLLTVEGRTREHFVQGGRALQRTWLRASSLGLAVQPIGSLFFMLARYENGGDQSFTAAEQQELAGLRLKMREIFSHTSDHHEVMMFRIAVADPPTARSLRRDTSQVLTWLP